MRPSLAGDSVFVLAITPSILTPTGGWCGERVASSYCLPGFPPADASNVLRGSGRCLEMLGEFEAILSDRLGVRG